MEKHLLTRFRERAQPMVNSRLPESPLELLFLMQHHGVPTRLLDWSENAFIALFFALSTAKKEGENYIGSSCVWMLDPVAWNKTVYNHINYDGSPFSVGDTTLENGYLKTGDGAAMMEKPVALFGVHNSPRIVSQRGVFMLFGSAVRPMEQCYEESEFPDGSLVKLEVKGGYQKRVFDELIKVGVSDSSVYPDLDGLAKELRRYYKFGV